MNRTTRLATACAPALCAALLSLAPAAQAAVSIQPGAACRSDGAVSTQASGELLNTVAQKASGDDRTLFTCPVVLTQDNLYGTGAMVDLYLRLNDNPVANKNPGGYHCALVTVKGDGAVFDATYVNAPTKTYEGRSWRKMSFSVNMPSPGTYASLLIRCAVPNAVGSDAAGVISYRVTF